MLVCPIHDAPVVVEVGVRLELFRQLVAVALADQVLGMFLRNQGPGSAAIQHDPVAGAMHFLGGEETHRQALESALVFHDLGL
jgi:hypothetical protein